MKAKQSNGCLTLNVEVVCNILLFLFSLQNRQVHNQMETVACVIMFENTQKICCYS